MSDNPAPAPAPAPPPPAPAAPAPAPAAPAAPAGGDLAVTNQELKIATTNSGLVETTTGADDECRLPTMADPKMFSNYGKLSEATEHTSERTVFADGRVVRVGDAVGPLTHEAHPPHIMRGKGGPYRQEARATEGAPNVFCEGKQPARYTDPTTQNKENTTGIVFDLGKTAELQKMLEDKLKRCSMKEDKIECDHGRVVDVGQVRVLEITDECGITLTAVRINAVESSDDPVCRVAPRHTEWTIHRPPTLLLSERKETLQGDEQYLDESWFGQWELPAAGAKQGDKNQTFQKDKVTGKTKDEALADGDNRKNDVERRKNEIRGKDPDNPKPGKSPSGVSGRKAQQQAMREYKEAQAAASQRVKDAKAAKDQRRNAHRMMQAGAQLLNLGQFLRVFFWDRYPTKIDISSQACTGGFQSQILVYPTNEVEFKFGQGEYEASGLKSAFKSIERWAQHLNGIAQKFGFGRIEIKILDEPEFGAKIKWKELTKDAPKAGKKKHQCNIEFKVSLKIKKIIGMKLEIPVPLAKVLDIFTGGGASALDAALRRFGVETSCGFGVTLDVGVEAALDKDEYWEDKSAGNLRLAFEFTFYLYARVVFGSRFNLEIRATVKWAPTLSRLTFKRDEFFYFWLDKGDIRLGLSGFFYVSVLWWERSYGGETWPESWRLPYSEQELHPIQKVMSLVGK